MDKITFLKNSIDIPEEFKKSLKNMDEATSMNGVSLAGGKSQAFQKVLLASVKITDEEIKRASKLLDESSIVSRDKEIGFMNCWNYIKSRINQ